MNPAAWERAKALLADAADLPVAERERFIVARCPDLGLRSELLEYLAAPAPLSDIIAAGLGHRRRGESAGGAETVAAGEAGPVVKSMFLPAGARLGPYEILSAVGAGGMGEVYRAMDTRLQRVVAGR